MHDSSKMKKSKLGEMVEMNKMQNKEFDLKYRQNTIFHKNLEKEKMQNDVEQNNAM